MVRQFKVIEMQENISREAHQEAEAREMRRVINFRSDMFNKENEVAERLEWRDIEEANRRQIRRECEARRHENIQVFQLRNFGLLLLFSLVCILDVYDMEHFNLYLSLLIIIGALMILNFFAYATRNMRSPKREGKKACTLHLC